MKTCLLITDLINEIIHEDGKAASCYSYVKEYEVIQQANMAIQYARENSLLIFL